VGWTHGTPQPGWSRYGESQYGVIFMTLAEVNSLRQTARAKMEDLISRTGDREMSTEEKQILADLTAEGQRLGSLATRYSALESFDNPVTSMRINREPVLTGADRAAAIATALDGFMRTGKFAADVPLQIQQSPLSGAAAAVPTDVIPTIVEGINDFDLPGRLGVTDFSRETTNPLVITMQTAAPAAATYNEGSAPSESTPPTYKTVTLAGLRYQNLTKYSIESRMNLGIPIVASVLRALALGQLQTQNSAFMAAFKTAMQGNVYAQIDRAGDSPSDAYSLMTRLKYGLPFFWQNSPNNRFLLSPSDLQKVKNTRSTQNQPLFDDAEDTILGKPYIVHPDSDRVYYGDFSVGCYRSRTPLYIQTLLELYAEHGLIGVSAYQFADWKFMASTGVQNQPVIFSNLDADGS
jgi:HK97 family phage major capsid protein